MLCYPIPFWFTKHNKGIDERKDDKKEKNDNEKNRFYSSQWKIKDSFYFLPDDTPDFFLIVIHSYHKNIFHYH